MESYELKEWGQLDDGSAKLLKMAMEQFHFSARAYGRIIKVARTLADLDGSKNIQNQHISESIQYRILDRAAWGQTY
jgi:magnesium chelatase family protein